ncbi:MAG: hypothetical protein PHV02_17280 [Rhodocyclaceae bacterium]|nr:hypothetical protein [Rhodocyclaceae bacterium]
MKTLALTLTLATAIGLNINPAQAADEGAAAITQLGEANGIALACQQMALVARARNAVVTNAPKTREIGEIFEAATNASYLKFGNEQKSCPDSASLAQQINVAEQRVSAAFPKP